MHADTPERFGPTVRVGDTSAAALDLMVAGSHDMLPVMTDEPTARFAGVVLRKALENGCGRMGHDVRSCRLHNHLKTDVTVVMGTSTGSPHHDGVDSLSLSTPPTDPLDSCDPIAERMAFDPAALVALRAGITNSRRP